MREEAARKLFAGPCDFVWGATSGAKPAAASGCTRVAFVGRSNAGKSSLINALTGRKSLARVSQTPGATRQINFFNLGGQADAGGPARLWLAKRPRRKALQWQEMIFSYLSGRARLRRVVLLIDARRGVMDSDLRGHGPARSDGRVLWPGADQGRRTWSGQPRRSGCQGSRREPPATPPPWQRFS